MTRSMSLSICRGVTRPRESSGRASLEKKPTPSVSVLTARGLPPNNSYRIRLYTSEHERETEYAEVGASGVQEVGAPLSQGHRSGAAHPPAYGLARVAGRADRRGSPDGRLLSEVDQGDPKALRGRRVRSPGRSSPRQPRGEGEGVVG